jgi:hypothetical protein
MPQSDHRPVRRLALLLAFLAVPALVAVPEAAAAQDVDLTGEWVFTVESPNGSGTRDVTLVQEESELTGTISSSRASGPITGTVEGDQVRFVAVVTMDTGDFEIIYEATIVGDRLVDGTVDFGDYGFGTFTGHRKEG